MNASTVSMLYFTARQFDIMDEEDTDFLSLNAEDLRQFWMDMAQDFPHKNGCWADILNNPNKRIEIDWHFIATKYTEKRMIESRFAIY